MKAGRRCAREVNGEKDPWECVGMAWKVQGLELSLQDTQVYSFLTAGACEDRCRFKALMPMNVRLESGIQQLLRDGAPG